MVRTPYTPMPTWSAPSTRHRVPDAVARAREEHAAQREPAEERGEHGGEGVRGVADEERERARPHHLVGQRGAAGEREGPQDAAHRGRVVQDGPACRLARHRSRHRRLALPHAVTPEPYGQRDQEVQPGADPDRAREADLPEQHVARGEAADHRAAGVERVERAHAEAERRLVPHHEAAQHGQGRPHERGGHAEQAEGEDEADEGEEPGGAVQVLVQPHVQRRERVEGHGQQHRGERDAHLERGVQREDARPAVDRPADPEAAQREAGHERGEHRAHGEHGVAEEQVEHARPGHLVEQAADAGQEEEREEERAPDRHGRGARARRRDGLGVEAVETRDVAARDQEPLLGAGVREVPRHHVLGVGPR